MPNGPAFPHPPSLSLAAIIDLDALAHNYHTICKNLKKGVQCATVLKANAYGLGLKEAAERLYFEGCRHFFVAHLTEAIELKHFVGEDSFIYVLNGLRLGEEKVYVHYNLIPVLSDMRQLRAWNSFAKSKNKCLKAALHFDTGMTRTGISTSHLNDIELTDISHTEISCVMSHLACAYTPSHPMNESQRKAFEDICKRFPFALASLSNSGGLFIDKKFQYGLVRAGLALTGSHPSYLSSKKLKPVMKAYAQILQIHDLPRGASVGYDATFIAPRASRIATLGVGYADGYTRALSNCGEVYCNGHLAPIVGKVSMDLVNVDITDIPSESIHVGNWVELFGDHLLVEDLAKKAGTIPWEILTQVGQRFERFYINKHSMRKVA